ncbi:hypothetical protein PTSG_04496 [Salpingoeca rosetta]|uniref:Carbohydrate deacetylase n=1 Tax=Salpingoeca rosetta (strain ATCC 50818 / BSB-021) TaxID=946362 RepID=F2U8Q8_SALR5|nr:uncharacterized protein PTSG_04496 [Salpingoeca rosetta]EGD72766.1 hypothetical protein PTSG_04496 [Salpingoeca rosetta]|eukprot:XP_004994589.1 hypothetical protein PTSG_04496 [Salpingoeca rosetta]
MASREAARMANAVDLPLGLHFNLTEGVPLAHTGQRAIRARSPSVPPAHAPPPPPRPLAQALGGQLLLASSSSSSSSSLSSTGSTSPPPSPSTSSSVSSSASAPLAPPPAAIAPESAPTTSPSSPSRPATHMPRSVVHSASTPSRRPASAPDIESWRSHMQRRQQPTRAAHVGGDGMFHGKHGAFECAACWHTQEVASELRAQLEAFQAMTGRPCRHLDAHNHIFILPQVYTAIAQYSPTHLRSVRAPSFHRHHDHASTTLSPFLQRVVRCATKTRAAFDASGLRMTDAFVGLDYDRPSLTADDILRDMRALIAQGMRTCELMAHPGYPAIPPVGGCGNAGPDAFSQCNNRVVELRVLTDPALKRGLQELDIELISFHDL